MVNRNETGLDASKVVLLFRAQHETRLFSRAGIYLPIDRRHRPT
jgi:hypothetical protein